MPVLYTTKALGSAIDVCVNIVIQLVILLQATNVEHFFLTQQILQKYFNCHNLCDDIISTCTTDFYHSHTILTSQISSILQGLNGIYAQARAALKQLTPISTFTYHGGTRATGYDVTVR